MKSVRTITILAKPEQHYESQATFVTDVNENGAVTYWCRITNVWDGIEEQLVRYFDLTGRPAVGNEMYKQYRGMGFTIKKRYTLNIDDSENWKYN